MITNNIFDILKQNLSFMKKKFSVKKIGVFGSYATGKPTESSDVDIVVVFEKPVGLSFVDFSEYIENLLGRPADILTPAGIAAIRNKKIANTIQGQIKYV